LQNRPFFLQLPVFQRYFNATVVNGEKILDVPYSFRILEATISEMSADFVACYKRISDYCLLELDDCATLEKRRIADAKEDKLPAPVHIGTACRLAKTILGIAAIQSIFVLNITFEREAVHTGGLLLRNEI